MDGGGFLLKEQKNTKKQGDVGLSFAIAYFSSKGHNVSIPLTDSQDYDLIVDIDDKLYKVQVKTSSYIRNNVYSVSISTKGGNRSYSTIKKFNNQMVDYIFILTENKDMYLIPTTILTNTSSINLSEKYQEYRVYL